MMTSMMVAEIDNGFYGGSEDGFKDGSIDGSDDGASLGAELGAEEGSSARNSQETLVAALRSALFAKHNNQREATAISTNNCFFYFIVGLKSHDCECKY
jgi:hypothetical protein